MLIAGLGQAEGLDTRAAVLSAISACRAKLAGRRPQAGLVFAGSGLDHPLMLKLIHDAFPKMALIGCTTDGEFSSALGFSEDSVCLLTLHSDDVEFSVGLGLHTSMNPNESVQTALKQARASLSQPPALCLALPDAHEKPFDPVLLRLTEELGPSCPVFGGCASALAVENAGVRQFFNQEIVSDALPILLLAGPVAYSSSIAQSWSPVGKPAEVTQAEGRILQKINHLNAVNFYKYYLGEHDEPAEEFILSVTEPGADHAYNRVPIAYTPDGGILLTAPVPVGSRVQLTEAVREVFIEDTALATRAALYRFKTDVPALALAFSGAFRKNILGTLAVEELRILKGNLPAGLPIMGFYTFGEISPLDAGGASLLHAASLVTLLIGPGKAEELARGSARPDAAVRDFLAIENDERLSVESLRKENEFLKRKLRRSEKYREHLEDIKDMDSRLHRAIADEIEAAHRQILEQETALRKSEMIYRRIIETTGEGFTLMDPNLRIVDVNDAYLRMLGYAREEVLGKRPFDLATEEFRRFIMTRHGDIRAQEQRRLEGELLAKDGRRVPVLIHGNTLRDDTGQFIGNVSLITDMTEHKKALQLAGEVQKSLQPQSRPNLDWLDVAGRSIPCEEIGGDYYDYIWRQDDPDSPFGAVVGDISGHGVDAALIMTTARAFLRMRAERSGGISDIVRDMNRHLTLDVVESGRFMTLFYLSVDRRERIVSWVRAGHDPALIYDPAVDRFGELKGMGMALGLDPEIVYPEYRLEMPPDRTIIAIGTDGIWEARNRDGEMYGKNRFRDAIRRSASLSAEEIVDRIYGELEAFTYGVRPKDDITLVILKFAGHPADMAGFI